MNWGNPAHKALATNLLELKYPFPAELTWAANINQHEIKARFYYKRKTCQSHGTVVSIPAANIRNKAPLYLL